MPFVIFKTRAYNPALERVFMLQITSQSLVLLPASAFHRETQTDELALRRALLPRGIWIKRGGVRYIIHRRKSLFITGRREERFEFRFVQKSINSLRCFITSQFQHCAPRAFELNLLFCMLFCADGRDFIQRMPALHRWKNSTKAAQSKRKGLCFYIQIRNIFIDLPCAEAICFEFNSGIKLGK
jgi:hypothetical protein